ncbi:MAG: hypothetical protein R2857_07330 [Vampirovibrionales bacterium]
MVAAVFAAALLVTVFAATGTGTAFMLTAVLAAAFLVAIFAATLFVAVFAAAFLVTVFAAAGTGTAFVVVAFGKQNRGRDLGERKHVVGGLGGLIQHRGTGHHGCAGQQGQGDLFVLFHGGWVSFSKKPARSPYKRMVQAINGLTKLTVTSSSLNTRSSGNLYFIG